MPVKRLFAAVELPDQIRSAVANRNLGLKRAFNDVRVGWERPEKLHFTLKFLGDTDMSCVTAVEEALDRAAAKLTAFTAVISGTGVFPNPRNPRILWVGLSEGASEMTDAAETVDSELAKAGFPRESRQFKPHLTIARIREPQKAVSLAEAHLKTAILTTKFTVGELVLFESELRPTGSVYTVLSKHVLDGNSLISQQDTSR